MTLTTHLHVVPSLQTNGAIPLLPLYTFMTWAGTALTSYLYKYLSQKRNLKKNYINTPDIKVYRIYLVIQVLRDLSSCVLVNFYRRFGGACCLNLHCLSDAKYFLCVGHSVVTYGNKTDGEHRQNNIFDILIVDRTKCFGFDENNRHQL
jgi:hypothetical protein